jgi:hypothetical protein
MLSLFNAMDEVGRGENADAAVVIIHDRCPADVALGKKVSRGLEGHLPREQHQIAAHQIIRGKGYQRFL